jgi:hypothetical protein
MLLLLKYSLFFSISLSLICFVGSFVKLCYSCIFFCGHNIIFIIFIHLNIHFIYINFHLFLPKLLLLFIFYFDFVIRKYLFQIILFTLFFYRFILLFVINIFSCFYINLVIFNPLRLCFYYFFFLSFFFIYIY